MNGGITGDGDRRARVLIVEDHPLIAELVATRLRIEGMEPLICLGGRAAMKTVVSEPVDLVILDIMMPDVDGYEVLRFIRSDERIAGLPVIFLTAKSSAEDISRGLGLGADGYITKPFSGADLVRRVKILLEQRRLGRRPAETGGQ